MKKELFLIKFFLISIFIVACSSFSIPINSNISFLGNLPFVNDNANLDLGLISYSWDPLMRFAVPMIMLLILGIMRPRHMKIYANVKIFVVVFFFIFYQFFNYFVTIGPLRSFAYTPFLELAILLYVISFSPPDFFELDKKMHKVFFLLGLINSGLILYNIIMRVSGDYSVLSIRFHRSTGISFDPIVSGIICAVTILILKFKRNHIGINTISYYLCMALFIITGLMTGSRSFVLLLLFLLYCFFIVKFKIRITRIFISLFLLLIFGGIFWLMNGTDSVLLFLEDDARSNKVSICWDVFREYPIFGGGPEVFAQRETAVTFSGVTSNPHNYFLQILVETGLIGFIPFLIVWGYSIIISIKRREDYDLIMILLLTISSLFIGVPFSLLLILYWFYFLSAIMRYAKI